MLLCAFVLRGKNKRIQVSIVVLLTTTNYGIGGWFANYLAVTASGETGQNDASKSDGESEVKSMHY
jgi:hypothetical protein